MIGGSGMLLLSSVAGYWVLERADRHKGGLRRIGQWLGVIIIAVSLVGVAGRVWCVASGFFGDGAKGGVLCPFAPRSSMPGSPSQ